MLGDKIMFEQIGFGLGGGGSEDQKREPCSDGP
jgi:hypothetical protein